MDIFELLLSKFVLIDIAAFIPIDFDDQRSVENIPAYKVKQCHHYLNKSQILFDKVDM